LCNDSGGKEGDSGSGASAGNSESNGHGATEVSGVARVADTGQVGGPPLCSSPGGSAGGAITMETSAILANPSTMGRGKRKRSPYCESPALSGASARDCESNGYGVTEVYQDVTEGCYGRSPASMAASQLRCPNMIISQPLLTNPTSIAL
jgi:hypothetical protein